MKSYPKAITVVFALAITACQPPQQQAATDKNANQPTKTQTVGALESKQTKRQLRSEKGHYLVKWQPVAQDIIPLNQYFALDVHLSEPLKAVDYPLELSLNAGMQAHNHGMHTKPAIKRRSNQHFVVEGMLFHMPGTWQIEFAISRGIIRDTAKLEVVL